MAKLVSILQYWGGRPNAPSSEWPRFLATIRRCAERGWSRKNTVVHRLRVIGPGDGLLLSQIGHLELIFLGRRIAKTIDRMRKRIKRIMLSGRVRKED